MDAKIQIYLPSWKRRSGGVVMMKRVLRTRSLPELIEWTLKRGFGLSTANIRMLPDFIIIGAQRCGTTSLYKYLCQHPEIHPSYPKEIHYFSNYYRKGINWYRSHFPLKRSIPKINRDGTGKYITGEATPYYLFHPLAPLRASITIPHAKIIVLLRDPIERAYSHFYHEVNMGVETLNFENAIREEESRLNNEFAKLVKDENYRSFNYQHFSYLNRGKYADQIQRWMQHFPSDSILILKSNDLNSDPIQSFHKVTEFLGLRYWENISFNKYHISTYPPMEEKTKNKLKAYFQVHNQKLYELTQIKFDVSKIS